MVRALLALALWLSLAATSQARPLMDGAELVQPCQAEAQVKRYLERHPQDLHQPAAALVNAALGATWPN